MVINSNQIDQLSRTNQAEQSDNSAVANELKKIAELRELEQKSDDRAYAAMKSDAKKFESMKQEKAQLAKLQKDPGIKVLSSLAKDLSAIGIDLTPRSLSKGASQKVSDEVEQMLSTRILKEDKADIGNRLTRDAV